MPCFVALIFSDGIKNKHYGRCYPKYRSTGTRSKCRTVSYYESSIFVCPIPLRQGVVIKYFQWKPNGCSNRSLSQDRKAKVIIWKSKRTKATIYCTFSTFTGIESRWIPFCGFWLLSMYFLENKLFHVTTTWLNGVYCFKQKLGILNWKIPPYFNPYSEFSYSQPFQRCSRISKPIPSLQTSKSS